MNFVFAHCVIISINKMNTISNRELSDPLCDSEIRGLTLVRLVLYVYCRRYITEILPKRRKILYSINQSIYQFTLDCLMVF